MPAGIRKLNKGIKNIRLNENNNDKNKEDSHLNEDSNLKSIQFKAELAWCRDHIKNEFDKAKNERRKESLWKAYNILNNEKISIIRKRKVMNQFCGDYRKHMNDEIARIVCQTFIVNVRNMSKIVKSSLSSNDPQNELNYIFLRKHDKLRKNCKIFQESTCDFKLDLPN